MENLEIFGVSIDTPTLSAAFSSVVALAKRDSEQCSQLAFVNADCLNIASNDWAYKSTLDQCERVFADGQGIRMAARAMNQPTPANVNGTDMFPLLCALSAEADGPSLYLLGGKPGVAARCADAMRERYPGVQIVGATDGYFLNQSEEAVLSDIAKRKPDILLVAMGAPLQEKWIAKHRARLDAGVAIGVGGLFDFYSGDVARAPTFVRNLGFEWVWRLAMEPRRLARRYLLGNPLFLWRVLQQKKNQESTRHEMENIAVKTDRRRRVTDIAISAIALTALSPILAIAATAIRFESPGPILFVQDRVGRDGMLFPLIKLRTMHIDAEARKQALIDANEMEGGVLFKMKKDPRITRVGAFLRKYSIDELPQFINIFKGDMAVAGPRPALPQEVALYGPDACERLRVRPGLTGLWQVSGRSALPFKEQVRLDIENVARRSQRFDAHLMLRTIPAVLKGDGAW